MKKIFLLLIIAFSSLLSTQAQDKYLTIGIGGGAAITTLTEPTKVYDGIGGDFFVNFYYNISPKFSMGAEFGAGAVFFEDPNAYSYESETASGFSNLSFRLKYHFGKSKVRPHIGFGTGIYSVTSPDFTSEVNYGLIPVGTGIGFSPEFGMNFGFFQLAAVYHYVPTLISDTYTYDSEYSNIEVRMVFNINFINR